MNLWSRAMHIGLKLYRDERVYTNIARMEEGGGEGFYAIITSKYMIYFFFLRPICLFYCFGVVSVSALSYKILKIQGGGDPPSPPPAPK